MSNTYRGNYPHRIKTVTSINPGLILVITNNGERYTAKPKPGCMAIIPKPGEELESLKARANVRKTTETERAKFGEIISWTRSANEFIVNNGTGQHWTGETLEAALTAYANDQFKKEH